MCFNDVIAFGVMLGLRQVGLEPGRDFAVIGYDDLAEAALWTPALSTVAVNSAGIGAAAVHLLLHRIEHPEAKPRRMILQPRLMLRASSSPPRVQCTDAFTSLMRQCASSLFFINFTKLRLTPSPFGSMH